MPISYRHPSNILSCSCCIASGAGALNFCVVLVALYRWTAVSIRVANTAASGLNRAAASVINACKSLSVAL
ncbi:TPA: hypothetical protein ACPTU9_004795 [Escherichia coli]